MTQNRRLLSCEGQGTEEDRGGQKNVGLNKKVEKRHLNYKKMQGRGPHYVKSDEEN